MAVDLLGNSDTRIAELETTVQLLLERLEALEAS